MTTEKPEGRQEHPPPQDDEWLDASAAIFGAKDPDVRPLVKMLRGNAPIPSGVRDMLAELLDPSVADYCDFKLELLDVSTKRNGLGKQFDDMMIAGEYERRLALGEKAENVAQDIADKKGIRGLVEKNSLTARTVFNYVEARASRLNWLRGKRQD